MSTSSSVSVLKQQLLSKLYELLYIDSSSSNALSVSTVSDRCFSISFLMDYLSSNSSLLGLCNSSFFYVFLTAA